MPIYEYRCQDCDNVFEEWHRGYEEKEITCPICKGKAKRLISNTAFILKGSGWYVTDYARNQDNAGGDGNGKDKGEGQAASSSQDTGSAKEQDSSQAGGESGGNGASQAGKESGSQGASKEEAGKKPTGQTPPSNSSSTE
ncbi:MAG: zinc ribbon domain-containing protein [Desulfohalobiaceae bacterium]|nr:zinc ribbon domain-containing protein [Desulfohalobiaceae bacterium]